MIENRNVNIIIDAEGNKLVLVNDIRFKGKQNIDWNSVKIYLEGYIVLFSTLNDASFFKLNVAKPA